MKHKELLVISSFPPRKCGIATYTQDLVNAIADKFSNMFTVRVCALQKKQSNYIYPQVVKYTLNTDEVNEYKALALKINQDTAISIVLIEHEFGLFGGEYGNYILVFLANLTKKVIITFHTVLPQPNKMRWSVVKEISNLSDGIIVMTNYSFQMLVDEYDIKMAKIYIIAHGTHLIQPEKINNPQPKVFQDKMIFSTFGLISVDKGIETALDAMPTIIAKFPNILYLVIGKTHPEVIKSEGETYRHFLTEKVKELNLEKYVIFINKYLSLEVLLEYLQRTDIYLFTSKNPLQAVSGTLAYAMSAGCPILSTPIPHALELLDGAGINFDFQNPEQLADAAIKLLSDPQLMEEMKLNALHRIRPTAWQNAAVAHISILSQVLGNSDLLRYNMPIISLMHIKRMTTNMGIIQFAKVDEPCLASGYTLDDNARALIAVAKHFELTAKFEDLFLIERYLDFIIFCQQEDGSFLNYVTIAGVFFDKNKEENLEDSNGRAIWALGEFLSMGILLNESLQQKVELAFNKAIKLIDQLKSPRAIAFSIKGLYYHDQLHSVPTHLALITKLADNLVSKYRGVSTKDWQWFEEYLTYANSLLPEAMLLAAKVTASKLYQEIAIKTFDYILSIQFRTNKIKVVSNQGWQHKGAVTNEFGEQPIEIAYTVLALHTFYNEFKEENYLNKLKIAFNWFLGGNHLNQIIYNPSTGGCYDGLEEAHVNLNQGAESTVSYLLARLTIEKYLNIEY